MMRALRIAVLVVAAPFTALHAVAEEQAAPHATLQRAAVMVKDRPATVAFYRDVLGYVEEQSATGITLPPDHPLGLPPDAIVSMSYMKSRDGAYVAVMGVDSESLPTLDHPQGSDNAYNDVILVHVVTDADEIYRRALAGGYTVLGPPKLSRTGAAKQLFLRDPNGIKIELNQMLKKTD
ncbi:MAG: VOC family protein [Rhodobacteraceae bacterium]|nr:VOC family protein [Paracoccaceae bacterium]